MPRRPSPSTLKSKCLISVAKNLELLSYGCAKGSPELRDLIDTEEFINIKGPFFDYPTSLLTDLSDTIYNQRAGSKQLLHLVIQPHLTRYEIGVCGSVHSTVLLIRERCSKSLKKLTFKGNRYLPPIHFVELFKALPNLTHLDLCGTIIDDIGLNVIGETAQKLVQLNVSGSAITNVGIKNLCFGDDYTTADYGRSRHYTYRCPDLIILEASETRVTAEGISLFVECHRNVIHIEHEDSFHCLQLAMQQNISNGNDSPFRLTQLKSTQRTLIPDQYEYTIDHCPSVALVTITSPGLSDTHLYKLMQLTNLSKLHLGNKFGNNSLSGHNNDIVSGFTFYEGVAPVLSAIGQNLKKLVLEDFQQIDLILIGQLCPVMEHLALSGIASFSPVLSSNENSTRTGSTESSRLFRRLNDIELWQGTHNSISEPMIHSLLSKDSHIRRMVFQRVDALSDSLFTSTLPLLLGLRQIVLDHCHNITVSSLWCMLEQPNELSSIQCLYCKQIAQKDKNEIKSVIAEENLALNFQWYPYIEAEEALLEAEYLNLDSEEEVSEEDDSN